MGLRLDYTQYLEAHVESVWESLSESVLRDQSLFEKVVKLQDDVRDKSNLM